MPNILLFNYRHSTSILASIPNGERLMLVAVAGYTCRQDAADGSESLGSN
jgi:hypothetical protein